MTIEKTSPCSLPTDAIVESLLFVASAPVSVRQLSEAIGCDVQEVETALQALAQEYQDRGLRLQRHGDQLQLVTAPESAPFVERLLGLSVSSSLSAAAIETLAIIAYKQPITRPEIEAIRGVSSDGVLRTLMSKGLVEEIGRLETVGHPILFGTTFEFLQYFGLSSLSELPLLESGYPGFQDKRASDGVV
jgi:segregation and condensation protein B